MAEDDTPLDPSQDAPFEDRFQDWGKQNLDWRTGRLLTQDPQAAINSMVDRGIPPPDFHAPQASGYADPDTPPSALPEIIRTNPNGTISGNITAPTNPDKPASTKPFYPTPDGKPIPPTTDLDPDTAAPEKVPLPTPRPKEAGPGSSDVSAKKKPDKADAVGDFAKSLSGVKALAPPPVNPVGTPSVRSPGSVNAPSLSALLQMAQPGAVTPPSILQTLGRLLVAGKA